ncbi:nicotinate phosphoribosyltransferase [Gallibacterium anatis]|uniref:nicotinate phosphoribosyltransferase n=1 Tax=Gallibacterium anatis TaxID=750 RepID=UPI000532299F|nr:nicotinate phosphoribosyltransferase [Gallibacterium anatis]KGQ43696.1 nicotinate phosphoribosyltransferase [Gallibacterium anatis]KGQ51616.1 nicotinate phosphoribosyltransferase [Gallibacterium anatis]KGQ58978.1 nicotinate phosphoribosyltransferase [Gallibacterium anatis]KGQ67525.1 nicotinate phosphoribosyltransferase [Gallibacterium anatis]
MDKNIILMSDSYKYSHSRQYPPQMTYMHHYIESRGGRYGYTQFFGLQYYLKKYLCQPITQAMIDEAEQIMRLHGLPFDRENWQYILQQHQGYLPLKIRAVPEGSLVNNHNVLLTVENTDPRCAWLVSFFETLLLKVWYPCTVATLSNSYHRICRKFLQETADSLDALPFMLHDFGYRGVSSEESAQLGGAAHLLNFKGTDNVGALLMLRQYYHAEMAGFSVPAAEHSTITSWSKTREVEAYEHLLDTYQNSVISIVVDSYDYYKTIEEAFCGKLAEKVKQRKFPLVLRPDSGDAISNVLFACERLENTFGVTVNSKGYKVLNNVKVLQGDGINENSAWDLLKALKDNQYSVENVILGCGGSLLQGNLTTSINRDTHRFAMKCSCVITEGKLVDVYKAPITDKGKVSKKGRLDLIWNGEKYQTINIDHLPLNQYAENSMMQTVFENGKLLVDWCLDDIQYNAQKNQPKIEQQ